MNNDSVPQPIPNEQNPEYVVIGVHGIFSAGGWVKAVNRTFYSNINNTALLSKNDVLVYGIRYKLVGLIQLWLPFYFRNKIIKRIQEQLQDYKNTFPNSKLIVIAHSLGTYVTCKAIQNNSFQIHRLVLCGSILPLSYQFSSVSDKISQGPIINECGSKDIWPPFAQAFSWGYGDIGTQGAGSPFVLDRFHDGGHGLYFTEEFISEYWKPLVLEEHSAPKDANQSNDPPWWMLFIPWIPLKYIILGFILWVGLLVYGIFDNSIHQPNPSDFNTGFNVPDDYFMELNPEASVPLQEALPLHVIRRLIVSFEKDDFALEATPVIVNKYSFTRTVSPFTFRVELPYKTKQLNSAAYIVRGSINKRMKWSDRLFGIQSLFGLQEKHGYSIVPLWTEQVSDEVIGTTVKSYEGDELWVIVSLDIEDSKQEIDLEDIASNTKMEIVP